MNPATSRGFRVWAASSALSALGDSITFFALVWVAASHGPGVASLVLTIGSIPLCLLVLVGGLAADRWGVRTVMVGCDLVMAVVMGAFAVGALWAVPVWALAVVCFLSGTAAALRRPAAGVFPRLFARDDALTRLMASLTLLLQVAQVTGPVVAGTLLAVGGLALTTGIDAVTFAVVGVVLLAVRPPLTPAQPQRAVWRRNCARACVWPARLLVSQPRWSPSAGWPSRSPRSWICAFRSRGTPAAGESPEPAWSPRRGRSAG